MNQVNNVGDLFWVDLKSLDVEKTKTFYQEWFGWLFRDENWGHRKQTVIYSGTERIGGLTDLRSPVYPSGTRPHASIYILVDQVDAIVGKAVEAGGKVLLQPFDLPGMGRMVTLQDQQGAVISVWEQTGAFTGIGKQEGAEERENWIVLYTTEVIQASDFYRQLLGWEIKRMNDGDGVGIWNRDKQIGVIVERSGPEKQLAAEWITGYMVGVLEKQCAIATRRLGSEQQRMSKMAYGVGPDGIPFVLIN